MKKTIKICRDIKNNNGKCYFVGGYVRDFIINKREAYDIDVEVYNISFEKLIGIISKYGDIKIHHDFNVIKFENIEFALPRTETKTGLKHNEFEIKIINDFNYKNALKRRDFTVNAIIMDVDDNTFIDPYNGIQDINDKKLKHLSENFVDDPLRVLRALRFSSQLQFDIDSDTLKLCNKMVNELDYISNERFSKEFEGFLSGEFIEHAIKYYNKLLSQYFKTSIISKYSIKSNNNYIKLLMFYYYFKNEDIEFMIDRTVILKNVKSDINFMRKYNVSIENLYYYTEYFDDDITIAIYNEVLSINIKSILKEYNSFCKEFNGKYLKEQGYTGLEIAIELEKIRKRRLNQLTKKCL